MASYITVNDQLVSCDQCGAVLLISRIAIHDKFHEVIEDARKGYAELASRILGLTSPIAINPAEFRQELKKS